MIINIDGIIVTSKDYKESSKIFEVLTEKGIISVIAKGCKGLKSPLRIVSRLTRATFTLYYKEDKLSTLKEYNVINDYKNIKKDYDLINYASNITNIAYQVEHQDNDNEIYNILISSLDKINNGFNPIVITDILLIKYLSNLGVPIYDRCVICGNKDNITTISSDKGGYICSNCRTNEPVLNIKTLKYIRMFNYINIGKIEKIEMEENIISEIHNFIINYYEKYTGIYLK